MKGTPLEKPEWASLNDSNPKAKQEKIIIIIETKILKSQETVCIREACYNKNFQQNRRSKTRTIVIQGLAKTTLKELI